MAIIENFYSRKRLPEGWCVMCLLICATLPCKPSAPHPQHWVISLSQKAKWQQKKISKGKKLTYLSEQVLNISIWRPLLLFATRLRSNFNSQFNFSFSIYKILCSYFKLLFLNAVVWGSLQYHGNFISLNKSKPERLQVVLAHYFKHFYNLYASWKK